MQTKDDLIMSVVNAHVTAGMRTDAEKQTGYGDRFLKAAKIIMTGGITTTSRGEYKVHSGTDANILYHVNGTCGCQDWKNWVTHEKWLKDQVGKDVTSFAPKGFCKHRLAVVIWGKVQAKLKWTVEQRIVHPHRWTCDLHRALPIECWQHACPDTEGLECPTCSRGISADPVTGEEENPNVPAYLENIIKEEAVPVDEYITHPDDDEYEGDEANAEAPTLTRVPEAVAVESEPPVTEELPPLVLTTPQYEPAPQGEPTLPPMPEAPVSFYIKFKVENFELSYTMRAHTDREVIARLPGVLAGLEDALKIEVDHDESFLKRLLHAFFPKPSKYSGK